MTTPAEHAATVPITVLRQIIEDECISTDEDVAVLRYALRVIEAAMAVASAPTSHWFKWGDFDALADALASFTKDTP